MNSLSADEQRFLTQGNNNNLLRNELYFSAAPLQLNTNLVLVFFLTFASDFTKSHVNFLKNIDSSVSHIVVTLRQEEKKVYDRPQKRET